METVDDGGFSTQTDIGLLGALMYELITGHKPDFDLFQDSDADCRAGLPRRSSLPSTEGLWLGEIVEKCWTAGFRDAHALSRALQAVSLEQENQPAKKDFARCFRDQMRSPIIMLAMTLGALVAFSTLRPRKT